MTSSVWTILRESQGVRLANLMSPRQVALEGLAVVDIAITDNDAGYEGIVTSCNG